MSKKNQEVKFAREETRKRHFLVAALWGENDSRSHKLLRKRTGSFERDVLEKLIDKLIELISSISSPRGLLSSSTDSLVQLYQRGKVDAVAEREREEKIRERWNQLLVDIFRVFSHHPEFKKAVKTFCKQLKPNIVDETHFISLVVFHIYRYSCEIELPELVRQPSARTRSQAVAAVDRLQRLFEQGARLENLADQAKLETFLDQLTTQMTRKPDKRPRNDETRTQRVFVKRLATSFLDHFDRPLTAVLRSLAAVVGYTPDESNIKEIIGEAKKEQQRARSVALYRMAFGANQQPQLGRAETSKK